MRFLVVKLGDLVYFLNNLQIFYVEVRGLGAPMLVMPAPPNFDPKNWYKPTITN